MTKRYRDLTKCNTVDDWPPLAESSFDSDSEGGELHEEEEWEEEWEDADGEVWEDNN